MARWILACVAAAGLCGCGYIGDPLPPAANIPTRVEDLGAVERGDRILVEFTAPKLTTEGLAIRKLGSSELRIGSDLDSGVVVPVTVDANGHARGETSALPFDGKSVIVAVRYASPKGRWSAWSNAVHLDVVAPLKPVAGLQPASDPGGVKLVWQPSPTAEAYRIFRRADKEENATLLARSDEPEYVDSTAQFGHIYAYSVQAVRKAGDVEAESLAPDVVTIKPLDTFPPAVPSGLNAIAGVNTIELAWERNTEPDLESYRIYRSADGGPFEQIADTPTPAYSDRKVESGHKYRYAISAVDANKNESQRCAPIEATAP